MFTPFYSLQFPDCDDDNAISVSCLDLCYSIKTGVLKDEEKDETAPVVLLDILEGDENDRIKENSEGGCAALSPFSCMLPFSLSVSISLTLFLFLCSFF